MTVLERDAEAPPVGADEASAASVADRADLEIRRGAAVAGLVTGPAAHGGVPHAAGVRLGSLRGFVSVTMVLSRAADVAARPDVLDKVIALGADRRDEPIPAPSRAELLSIVAGG